MQIVSQEKHLQLLIALPIKLGLVAKFTKNTIEWFKTEIYTKLFNTLIMFPHKIIRLIGAGSLSVKKELEEELPELVTI